MNKKFIVTLFIMGGFLLASASPFVGKINPNTDECNGGDCLSINAQCVQNDPAGKVCCPGLDCILHHSGQFKCLVPGPVDLCPSDPNKTDPGICGCGVPDVDTDGDGTMDCLDGCPLDAQKIAAGVCGCGVADVDTDGDGTEDCIDLCPLDPLKIDPGVCGCGVPEGTCGPGPLDLCPNDPNKTDPGICGCGVPDVDTDGDGTEDCIDLCPLDPLKIDPGVCGCGVPEGTCSPVPPPVTAPPAAGGPIIPLTAAEDDLIIPVTGFDLTSQLVFNAGLISIGIGFVIQVIDKKKK